MADVAEVLNKAADHIERVGWHRGNYFKGVAKWAYIEDPEKYRDVACCALGAIRVVEPMLVNRVAACDVLRSSIKESSIHAWNDKPSQTKARVLAKLRRVAKESLA